MLGAIGASECGPCGAKNTSDAFSQRKPGSRITIKNFPDAK